MCMVRPYYIFKSGVLKREENTLVLRSDKDEKIRIPIADVLELFLFGEVTLNTRLLTFLARKEILVHFFDWNGNYQGSFTPRKTLLSGEMLVRQVEHFLDFEKRMDLARRFVIGAMRNMRVVLRELGLETIEVPIEEIDKTKTVEELMSIEAQFRKAYYALLDTLLPEEYKIGTRSRRPPLNEANAMLSFLNGLTYAEVVRNIYKTHLDPRVAYLHTPGDRRNSLSLDVAEIFKPILAERIFLRLVRKREVKEEDFKRETRGVFLSEKGMKKLVKAFDEKLESTFYHRRLRRKVSYRTLIRLELYKIEKHLLHLQPYEPYHAQW